MFHSREIVTAIELGSSKICVLIGEAGEGGRVNIIGRGTAPSAGAVVKGEIYNMEKAFDQLAAALEEAVSRLPDRMARLAHMRDRLIDGILAIPHTVLNGTALRDAAHRLPGTVNVCVEGIEGESLLLRLDLAGICASSGSACTSGSLEPSHVLLAIGRPAEIAHGSLRLSLSETNTEEDVDYILEKLPGIIATLRDMSPVWEDLETGRLAHRI